MKSFLFLCCLCIVNAFIFNDRLVKYQEIQSNIHAFYKDAVPTHVFYVEYENMSLRYNASYNPPLWTFYVLLQKAIIADLDKYKSPGNQLCCERYEERVLDAVYDGVYQEELRKQRLACTGFFERLFFDLESNLKQYINGYDIALVANDILYRDTNFKYTLLNHKDLACRRFSNCPLFEFVSQ